MATQSFSPERLAQILTTHSPVSRYVLAYSGGMDSHVLLHVLHRIHAGGDVQFDVVHVHHGLSPNADDWARHCEQTCRQLSLPCRILRVQVSSGRDESLESAARRVRYAALAEYLPSGCVLLTAHHRDDQAETFLLRLLRGSGVTGLSAIPVLQPFAQGWLCRPLLDFDRRQLVDYARQQQLQWVEDETNEDIGHDRNYIRKVIMPALQQRWPSAQQVIHHSAGLMQEAHGLHEQLARIDAQQDLDNELQSLSVTVLQTLPVDRRKNLLRYWITQQGRTTPPSRRLEIMATAILDARDDSQPLVAWADTGVRRYQDRLYLVPTLPPVPANRKLDWDFTTSLQLPLGELRADPGSAPGLQEYLRARRLQVAFRQGGERYREPVSGHHHTLRNLLQNERVPTWLRDYIPLLYLDDELVIVPGVHVSKAVGNELAPFVSRVQWLLPSGHPGGDREPYCTFIQEN